MWTLSGFQPLGQGLAWTFGRTSLSPNIKDGSLKCGTSEQHNTLGSVLQAAPPLFLTAFPEASTGPYPAATVRLFCPPKSFQDLEQHLGQTALSSEIRIMTP